MNAREVEEQLTQLSERLARVEADLGTVPSVVRRRADASAREKLLAVARQREALLADPVNALGQLNNDELRLAVRDLDFRAGLAVARTLEGSDRARFLAIYALDHDRQRVDFYLRPAPPVVRVTTPIRPDGSRLSDAARSRDGKFIVEGVWIGLQTEWTEAQEDDGIAGLVAAGYLVADQLSADDAHAWAWGRR